MPIVSNESHAVGLITRDSCNALRYDLRFELSMTQTKTNNHSLQIAALLTIAVLTIGTMQFAAAGGEKIEGDFENVDNGKAKFETETKDGETREKLSVEIKDDVFTTDDEYTVTILGVGVEVFSPTVTLVDGEIDLNIDTQCDDTQPGDECEQEITDLPNLVSGDVVIVSLDGVEITRATLTED